MNISDNAAFIEALLFLENEPMSVERLQKMTGLSEKQVTEALEELTEA